MRQERGTREHRCSKCGKTYTSMMRLLHHQAADHAARTLKDIRTMKDVKHSTGS